ncbi:MAG: DUF1232 domain-containing protein [Clostridium sp.]|nr:DUF1232 domain-containing protein [Clostridium sp.]
MFCKKIDYDSLLKQIARWSTKAGRAATRPVLLMWYVMRNPETPRRDKWAIFLSLAYIVFPIDLLSAKRLPIIGWLDEILSLAVLIRKMTEYITPAIEAKTEETLDDWFGVDIPPIPKTSNDDDGPIDVIYETIVV